MSPFEPPSALLSLTQLFSKYCFKVILTILNRFRALNLPINGCLKRYWKIEFFDHFEGLLVRCKRSGVPVCQKMVQNVRQGPPERIQSRKLVPKGFQKESQGASKMPPNSVDPSVERILRTC